MAVKIAKALEVFLDDDTTARDFKSDKAMPDRVQEVTQPTEKDKNHIFVRFDVLIRDFKNKPAYVK